MKAVSALLMLAAPAACALPAAAPRCNPEQLELVDQRWSNETHVGVPASGWDGEASTAVMLPQDKGGESPACLDGSAYGFYFVPSKTGSTKWTVSINGGGWCYDEVDCQCRSLGGLGTSKGMQPSGGCGCINPKEDGTMDADCNCIHLPYSDGASFSGFVNKAMPVPGMPQGCKLKESWGSQRTPWRPLADSLDPLQIGKVP
jgi:hypothetical protein